MIQIYCLITGNWGSDVVVQAVIEADGELHSVCDHLSSSVAWAQRDIGIGSDCKHGVYDKAFGAGNWTLEWVPIPAEHPILSKYCQKVVSV